VNDNLTLQPFTDLVAVDSMVAGLHEVLKKYDEGCRSNHSKSALKVNGEFQDPAGKGMLVNYNLLFAWSICRDPPFKPIRNPPHKQLFYIVSRGFNPSSP